LQQEILNVKEDKIDRYYLNIALKKILGEIALKEKIIEKDLEMQVNLLETKIQNLKVTTEKITNLLEAKGKKRVKWFLGFLTAQIALIQYGTYVAFSWDIIEPITCLLGVMDLIIAYSFWLYSQKEYSFETLKTHYIFRRINYYVKFNFGELLVQKQSIEEEIKIIEKLLNLTSMKRNI